MRVQDGLMSDDTAAAPPVWTPPVLETIAMGDLDAALETCTGDPMTVDDLPPCECT